MANMPFTDKLDAGKSNEQLFAERAQRLQDALALRATGSHSGQYGRRLLPGRVRRHHAPGAAG